MLAPLLGYFVGMITVLTAAAVFLTGFLNISPSRKETQHFHPPTIGRTVMVETQRHSRIAKEEAPAKDVSPVVATAKANVKTKDASAVIATAKADVKKSKHYKSKVVARQRNNYGYGTALGYAQDSGYAPRGPFFQ